MVDRFKVTIAVNLILRQDDKILLLKRSGTNHLDGNYNCIAGHLEANELATAAIIREAHEEVGIKIEPANLKFVQFVQRLPKDETEEEYIDLFYEVSKWQGEPVNAEPNKSTEISWVSADNLPANTAPILLEVLSNISKGITYSEYTKEPK